MEVSEEMDRDSSSTDMFIEMRCLWRGKFVEIFQKALALRLMLEDSPLEYRYHFPGFRDRYEDEFMEEIDQTTVEDPNKVCLCLRTGISSRPRSSRTTEPEQWRVVVPARVLLF